MWRLLKPQVLVTDLRDTEEENDAVLEIQPNIWQKLQTQL